MAEELPSGQRAIGYSIAQADRGGTAIVYAFAPPSPPDAATIAAAEALLAAMPLDVIPGPAPLPVGSRMRLSPNPLFVGREADLRALARVLKGGETVAVGPATIAATGLGGIGKTQLAVEFVHRYGRYFAGGVFWLSFGEPDAVPAEIAACGEPGFMDLRPDFAALPQDQQVELVRATWRGGLPRLLVFDNCEEEALIQDWRPATGSSRVLVTARRPEWDPVLGVQPLRLGVLNRQESVALLRKYRPDLAVDASELDAIAEALGDLPLALHLAGSFLRGYRHAVSPAQYLAQLRRPGLVDHRYLAASSLSPTDHVQHVGRTFALSGSPSLPVKSEVGRRVVAPATVWLKDNAGGGWPPPRSGNMRKQTAFTGRDGEPRCPAEVWPIGRGRAG